MKKLLRRCGGGLVLAAGFSAVPVSAQGGDDLRAASQNPISSLISVPFKFTFDNGADNGNANFYNINPVLPVTAGNWNLVNRILVPLVGAPGGVAGLPSIPNPVPSGKREFGLGDINYSLYVSPVKYNRVIWGLGPSTTLPTATSKQLGSAKLSIGPSAVALTPFGWGSIGVLGRQLWSVAGDSERENVSQLLVEPFVNYNLVKGWFLFTDMVMTSNWRAPSGSKWTVPVGGGAGRVFSIGPQAINAKLEAYYNAVRPDSGPTWSISLSWVFLFPK